MARAYFFFSSAHLLWFLNSFNLIASFRVICLALLELESSINPNVQTAITSLNLNIGKMKRCGIIIFKLVLVLCGMVSC